MASDRSINIKQPFPGPQINPCTHTHTHIHTHTYTHTYTHTHTFTHTQTQKSRHPQLVLTCYSDACS